MALDAKVFGRPAPAAVARDVMSSPSLHLTPAPSQPADLVEHPNLANYYNALDSCYEILKKENDPRRRLRVEEARQFFESAIAEFEEPDTSAAPPMPTPPMAGQVPVPGQGPPGAPAPVNPMAATGGSLPAPPMGGGPVPAPSPPLVA